MRFPNNSITRLTTPSRPFSLVFLTFIGQQIVGDQNNIHMAMTLVLGLFLPEELPKCAVREFGFLYPVVFPLPTLASRDYVVQIA